MNTTNTTTKPIVFAADLDVDPRGKQDWILDLRPLEPFLMQLHTDVTRPAIDRSSAPVGKVDLRVSKYGNTKMYLLITVQVRRASALQGEAPLYTMHVISNTRPEYTMHTNSLKEQVAERAVRSVKRMIQFYLSQLGWSTVQQRYINTLGPRKGTPSDDVVEFWCAPCAGGVCGDKQMCERHLRVLEGAQYLKA